MPPSVLYLVTRAHVSEAKRLSGLRGLMVMHSSTLLPEALLMLTLAPTVRLICPCAGKKATAKPPIASISNPRLNVRKFNPRPDEIAL